MCGVAGILAPNRIEGMEQRLGKMQKVMEYRGPDDSGTFIDSAGCGLAHVRLAIFDPAQGKQPMTCAEDRFVLIFNGAIYNYLELRTDLLSRGHPIRSYSDTEVLLYAYKEWGEECLQRLNGMFAFCIWDKHAKTAFLARDRLGIKPLYYHVSESKLVFGSEIKSIIASGLYKAEHCQKGLSDYLTLQFVMGSGTLFKGVKKLDPGCALKVTLHGGELSCHECQYWDVPTEVDRDLSETKAVEQLSFLIDDAIRLQMRSDVPLGAHLSGGLDSSTVVCVAQSALTESRLETFTGYFAEGPEYSELSHAEHVVEQSGAQGNSILIRGDEFDSVLPKIIWHMDEPAAGPGVIPQYYVSQFASSKVKVALGGQGGDELFVGYARYLIAYLEEALKGAIFETSDREKHVATLGGLIPGLPALKNYAPLMQKFWATGLFEHPSQRYFQLINRSDDVKSYIKDYASLDLTGTQDRFMDCFEKPGLESLVNRITNFELKTSLTSLLQVEDRTSMAASLESRVPLLDHRIVEHMFRVPPMVKFKDGNLKHLFKQAVRPKIPVKTLQRKDKMGFPVPLQDWMRGRAKDFVDETLLGSAARDRGLFNPEQVRALVANEGSFSRTAWGLLCLELWFQQYIDG